MARYTVVLDIEHDDPHSEPVEIVSLLLFLLDDPDFWRVKVNDVTAELAE